MHVRRPLVGLVLCFIIGTWCGLVPAVPSVYPFAAACVLMLGWAVGIMMRSTMGLSCMLLAAVAFTAWSAAAFRMERSAHAARTLLCQRAGTHLELIGVVTDDPVSSQQEADARPLWNFRLKVEELRLGPEMPWRNAGGNVNVHWRAPQKGRPPSYGERWQIPGKVYFRSPAFRAEALPSRHKCRLIGNWYRAKYLSGAHGNPFIEWCYAQRKFASRYLAMGIEDFPNHVALLHALVLGYRQKLPANIRSNFAFTGTLHVFAISGLHSQSI